MKKPSDGQVDNRIDGMEGSSLEGGKGIVVSGLRAASTVLFAGTIACSGSGGDTTLIQGRIGGNVPLANAAEGDAGLRDATSSDVSTESPVDVHQEEAESLQERIPEKPSYISFQIEEMEAGELLLTTMNGEKFPFKHSITEGENGTVLTLYLPRGKEVGIMLSRNEDGSISKATPLTIASSTSIGTGSIQLDEKGGYLEFGSAAEKEISLGRTVLDEGAMEFLDGKMQKISQGLFLAEEEGDYRIEWEGGQELYSFVDGPPVLHESLFTIHLNKGQSLPLWIVNEDGNPDSTKVLIIQKAMD